MAQSVQTSQGVVFVPGTYVTVEVDGADSGATPAQGVIFGLGEADDGPRFDEEIDPSTGDSALAQNFFGPDEIELIRNKYGAGRLVNMAHGAANPSLDQRVPGAFSAFYPVKVNRGSPGQMNLAAIGSGTYAAVSARAAGARGNQIAVTVKQNVAEVAPTTGAFLALPPQVATDVSVRVSGGLALTTTIGANSLPTATQAALDALLGVTATGGTNRALLTATGATVTVTVDSGFQCHFVISTSWAAVPLVGDLLYLPTGSPFASANKGGWVITAATATRIDAYKLLDAAGTGATRTNPTSEGPITIVANTDAQAFAPVVLFYDAGTPVAGTGKTLEIAESGSNHLGDVAYSFVSAAANPPAAKVAWVSKAGAPVVLNSASEYQVDVAAQRASDAVNEDLVAGGDVLLELGYSGTSAQLVVSADQKTATITVVGGAGTSPPAIALANYPTTTALAAYIGSLTGFVARAASAQAGQASPAQLDPGTYRFATTNGGYTGRIKRDGAALRAAVNASVLIMVATQTPLVGLPVAAAMSFLSGGARGAASNADFAAALDAILGIDGNFVVAAVDQDAAADIAANDTDAASTYDVASVNASIVAHVLAASSLQRQKQRQACLAHRGTFLTDLAAAGVVGNPRATMSFEDCLDNDATGTRRAFGAWMTAAKVAGLQAAAGPKAIFGKRVGVSGVSHPGGGVDLKLQTDVKRALQGGLLPIIPKNGGFQFSSDQTTYLGSNPVLNSMRGVYSGDVAAATLRVRLDEALFGENSLDTPASNIKTTAERILRDLQGQGWIGRSDEAPGGFKDLVINRRGPAVFVSVKIIDNVANYFIVVRVVVGEPQQTA